MGAREPVANRLTPRDRAPERIVFHHTAKKFNSTNISDIKAEIRRVQNLHMDDKDYPKCDIAYHYIIDPSGEIWQGAAIDDYKRGHADGHFDDIGVVLLGNFEPQLENLFIPNILNDYQKNAMKELSKWLCFEHNLTPASTDENSPITTHRIVDNRKACPGKEAAPWIENDLKNYIIEWYSV